MDPIKLNDYINFLKNIKKKHGNLPLVYASDDEGNAYHKIYYQPQPVHMEELGNELWPLDKGKPNHILVN